MNDDRKRKLMFVGAGAVVIGMFLFAGNSGDTGTASHPTTAPVASHTPPSIATASPMPAISPQLSYGKSASTQQSYAIAAAELQGLPPDATPGTKLRLWVTWDPPITDLPEIRVLLDSVTLERIVPPAVPEGPETALLSVSAKQVPDLLYGDRYGALSVTVIN